MRNLMYWGLGVLIVGLIIGGVFLIHPPDTDTDTEPEKVFKGPSVADQAKDLQDQETEQPVMNRPPPPGETKESGYWHGDHWHRYADVGEQTDVPPQSGRVLTAEEKAKVLKFWADQGLEPPPPGHGYEFDEDGNAKLFKYNEPRFTVRWTKDGVPGADMNKLTSEEWQRYNILDSIVSGDAWRLENHQIRAVFVDGEPWPQIEYAPGVQELAAEWMIELNKKASAKLPSLVTSITWDHEPTPEEEAEVDRQKEAILAPLRPPVRTDSANITQAAFDAVVRELEAELASRR